MPVSHKRRSVKKVSKSRKTASNVKRSRKTRKYISKMRGGILPKLLRKKLGRAESYSLEEGHNEIEKAEEERLKKNDANKQQMINQEVFMKKVEKFKSKLKIDRQELNNPDETKIDNITTRKSSSPPQLYWWQDIKDNKFCYTYNPIKTNSYNSEIVHTGDTWEDNDLNKVCYTDKELLYH